MTDTVAEKRTPLYAEHLRRGAKVIPFGGWLMPVQYTSIVDEHLAVRKNAGIFDISHMGQLIVSGEDAAGWLNKMLTNNVEKLEAGQGQYTFLLNGDGGIIDDLIAYHTAPNEYLLVVNASRTDEDFAWLERHKPASVQLKNRSSDFGGVAIQGPRIVELFHDLLGKGQELPPRNHIRNFEVGRMPISIARTGYTGEDGVEVFFRAQDAAQIWNLALDKGGPLGLKPCGLGARDTLRLEMCYPLNGSDLSPEHNPDRGRPRIFCRSEQTGVCRSREIGARQRQGPSQKLAPFRMTGKGPPPRPHYSVFKDGERLGEVTSGTLSPSLNYGIGMAYLPAAQTKIGTAMEIEIRGQKFPALIEKKPFYKKS